MFLFEVSQAPRGANTWFEAKYSADRALEGARLAARSFEIDGKRRSWWRYLLMVGKCLHSARYRKCLIVGKSGGGGLAALSIGTVGV